MPLHSAIATAIGADVRGFYRHLGIDFPERALDEASVRCFADPDAHRNGDHRPSCSINLEHGAWCCHGCGAKGGAYDAAVAVGYSSRSAWDLVARYGIRERSFNATREPGVGFSAQAQTRRLPRPRFAISERDVRHWQKALGDQPDVIVKLTQERGWLYSTMLELELGYDHGRITIPVRDHTLRLVGLLWYQPWREHSQPKMLAAPGSRRALLPHPAIETSQRILLVEGEPDMIAARSRGVAAIALPGANTWRPEWASLFIGRDVTILMDCDREGRNAATRISKDLIGKADVYSHDIAPGRDDGYDLSDLYKTHPLASREPTR